MHRGSPFANEAELDDAVRGLGLPLILKTAASGYDGKGQILVETADQASGAWASLGRSPCVAEGWVDFAAELSVVVARGVDGRAVCYPVALNRHERHILDTTLMPAPVGPIVALEARGLALTVAQALETVGVLTVEFFLTADGQLMVNEIAPRPHNSGHLTIEAAIASQFEQQVRALCGLALGPTDLVMPAAMVNLLGDLWAMAGGEPRWDRRAGRRPGRDAPPLRQADARDGPENGPPDCARPRSRGCALPRVGRAPGSGRRSSLACRAPIPFDIMQCRPRSSNLELGN